VALSLMEQLPGEARFVPGDAHYDAPEVRAGCLASGRGPYPRTDPGAEVRRVFHRLRHASIENFDEHFKSVLECHAAVPTKGLSDTALRFGGGLRLPAGAASPQPEGFLHQPRDQSLPQSRLSNYDRASASQLFVFAGNRSLMVEWTIRGQYLCESL